MYKKVRYINIYRTFFVRLRKIFFYGGESMNISYKASDFYNKISSNGNSYVSSYRKNVREADLNVQNLQKDIERFRKSVRKLKNFDPDTITSNKLEKYLENFSESYNKLKDSGEKITDKELSKTLSNLDDFMKENKKSLKKLGLKESNGEWEFDSEELEETKESDVNKMFKGKDALFKKLDKLMRNVEKKADEEEYQIVLRKFRTVTKFSDEEMWQGSSAFYAQRVVGGLQELNMQVQNYDAAINDADTTQDIKEGIDAFVWAYDDLLTKATDSVSNYTKYMIEKTKEAETVNNFSKLGITVEDDGTLKYYSDAIINDTFKEGYAALFGENAAYGNLMKQYAKDIFNITMKTESLGITIDSYA